MSAKATFLYILVVASAAFAGFFSGRAGVHAPAPLPLACSAPERSASAIVPVKREASSWVFDDARPKKHETAEKAPANAPLPVDSTAESSTVYESLSAAPPDIARIEAARLGQVPSSDQYVETKEPPSGTFIATIGPDGQPRLKLNP